MKLDGFLFRHFGIRFFTGLFLLMMYTLTMSYRGSLNAFFTITSYPKPMDTIKELAASVNSSIPHDFAFNKTLFQNLWYLQDLQVASFGTTFKNSILNSLNPHLKKISENYMTHYNFGEAFQNASTESLILAESQQFLQFNVRKRYTNKFGAKNKHIMKECFNSYQAKL